MRKGDPEKKEAFELSFILFNLCLPQAHFLATEVGLLPRDSITVRTIDTGGAGPVSGLLEARRMIGLEG